MEKLLLHLWMQVAISVSLIASEFSITRFESNGQLTFKEVSGALSYRVEWSTTLAPGSWSSEPPGIAEIPAQRSGDRTVFVTRRPGPCFYRVVAVLKVLPPEDFVLIPAGTFQMGASLNEGWSDELPVHAVGVSAFFLQARETTKAEWDTVRTWALANGYTFDNTGEGKEANHPVHSVSWYDVVKWCNARSEKEGLVPCYYTDAAGTQVYKTRQVNVTNDKVLWTANGYRLPTEAEWEKAARGGLNGKQFAWGDTISHSQANYYSWEQSTYDISPTREYHPTYAVGNIPYTSPVGSFAANGYGLYDMTGNVFEWCWDWFDSYDTRSLSDPRGASSGSFRVLRGGSWGFDAFEGRVANRYGYGPSRRYDNFGFRLARGL